MTNTSPFFSKGPDLSVAEYGVILYEELTKWFPLTEHQLPVMYDAQWVLAV